jgi:hypothetical protein
LRCANSKPTPHSLGNACTQTCSGRRRVGVAARAEILVPQAPGNQQRVSSSACGEVSVYVVFFVCFVFNVDPSHPWQTPCEPPNLVLCRYRCTHASFMISFFPSRSSLSLSLSLALSLSLSLSLSRSVHIRLGAAISSTGGYDKD